MNLTGPMIARWAIAFAFTQAVEVPLYCVALGLRSGGAPGAAPSLLRRAFTLRHVAIAFGASALTHPFVWFLFPRLVRPYWTMVAFAEAFAVIAEAAYLTGFRVRWALAWSFAVNASSVVVGLTSRALFGVP